MDIFDTLICKISFVDTIEQLPNHIDLMEAYQDGGISWKEFKYLRDELSLAFSTLAQGVK